MIRVSLFYLPMTNDTALLQRAYDREEVSLLHIKKKSVCALVQAAYADSRQIVIVLAA